MKHYSEIIRKVINEKSNADKNQTENEEEMNTISYTLNKMNAEPFEIEREKSTFQFSRVHEAFERLNFNVSKVFVVAFKVAFNVIRFIVSLIRIILKSTLHV